MKGQILSLRGEGQLSFRNRMKSDANTCSQRTVMLVVVIKAKGVSLLWRKVGQEQKSSSLGPEVSYTHTSACSCAKGKWESQRAWNHHVPNHEYSTGPTVYQTWMGSSGEPAQAHETHSETSAWPERVLWYLGQAAAYLMMAITFKPNWSLTLTGSSQFIEPQNIRIRELIKSPQRHRL